MLIVSSFTLGTNVQTTTILKRFYFSTDLQRCHWQNFCHDKNYTCGSSCHKNHSCHDKSFVTTNTCLSQQTHVCHNTHVLVSSQQTYIFVATNTNIILSQHKCACFVTANIYFCCDKYKHNLVKTNIILSWIWFCHGKHTFVMTKDMFCCDKTCVCHICCN